MTGVVHMFLEFSEIFLDFWVTIYLLVDNSFKEKI